MPVDVKMVRGGLGMEVIAVGVVTGKEIVHAIEQAYESEDLSRIRYKLIDRMGCTAYQVSSDEVRRIAKLDQALGEVNPNVVMVFVSTTPLQYGMTRVWQAYTDKTGFPQQMFEDRESAEKWLREHVPAFGEGFE